MGFSGVNVPRPEHGAKRLTILSKIIRMKTIEDIRLEIKISDMIYTRLGDLVDLNILSRKDFTDICEALAVNIIKAVKEAR